MSKNVYHPFYCIGCGEIQPDKETYDKHYKECWLDFDDNMSDEQIEGLVNGEDEIGDR